MCSDLIGFVVMPDRQKNRNSITNARPVPIARLRW